MALHLSSWQFACVVLFAVSAALFVWTALRRHRMDAALAGYGLAAPERRWTYDHDYIVRFLGALLRSPPSGQSSPYWLDFYAGPILRWDLAFAVCFATFIALASVLISGASGAPLWLSRVTFLTAAMGIVYGVADIAEDLKLRSILRNAVQVHSKRQNDHDELKTDLADAAEVDATNTLTRIKIATIGLSVVGLVAFLIFMGLAEISVFLAGGRPQGGAMVAPQG